jgi:hypothetical protein
MTKHRPIAAKKHPPAKHDGRVTHKTTAAGVSRLPLADYRDKAETLTVHSAAVLAALLAGLALTAALLLTGLLAALLLLAWLLPALLRITLLRVALLLLVAPRIVLLLVRHGWLSSDFVGVTATLRPSPAHLTTRESGPGSVPGSGVCAQRIEISGKTGAGEERGVAARKHAC